MDAVISRCRALAALVLGMLLAAVLLVVSAPAADAEQSLPDDVAAAFSAEALRELADAAEEPGLSTAVGFGTPHRVHLWSRGIQEDADLFEPVLALDEWVAPVLDARGEALGVYRAWRPEPDADAEWAGYDPDRKLAAALDGVPADAVVVNDPTIAAWYALEGDTLTAIDARAEEDLPEPASLESFAQILTERRHERNQQHEGPEFGLRVLLPAAGVAVLGLAGALYLIRARRRQTG